jgi:hypothetical protein
VPTCVIVVDDAHLQSGYQVTANFGGGVTYTYTGNIFNFSPPCTVSSCVPIHCPPICNISGSFTVPKPLPPNLGLTRITVFSIRFTDGSGIYDTFDPSAALPPGTATISVATDSQSNLTQWSIVLYNHGGPPFDAGSTQLVTGTRNTPSGNSDGSAACVIQTAEGGCSILYDIAEFGFPGTWVRH